MAAKQGMHRPHTEPVFKAREGMSADFRDIAERAAAAEPKLGLDESLGIRWIRLRGKLIGLRYGNLQMRRMMEIALERTAEKRREVAQQLREERGGEVREECLAEARAAFVIDEKILEDEELEAVVGEMTRQRLSELVAKAMKEIEYQAGLDMYAPLLVMPALECEELVRPMTRLEIEQRIDLPDFEPLSRLAFPPVSPLQALLDAGADPN